MNDTVDRIERALLGALIVCGSSALELVPRLRPAHFRSTGRAAVAGAILALALRGAPVEAITVVHELETMRVPPPPGKGWGTAIGELMEWATVGALDDESIRYYGRMVEEESRRRVLRSIAEAV